MEERKQDHIELAFSSQVREALADPRFFYEPLLGSHGAGIAAPIPFLGRSLRLPMWVSSMTGGTAKARRINENLARACNEFGMGMGLGSCRILLDNEKYLPDFDMRPIIGPELPLYANIGIVQLEEMMHAGSWDRLCGLVERLKADGIIIHVNPIQEFLQQEGDRLQVPPVETIERFLSETGMKTIIKEVGQGMGPSSLARIMALPVEAIELAGFGGTNFARIEMARNEGSPQRYFEPLALLGHTAGEMITSINALVAGEGQVSCRQVIISGGITGFLDGFYYMSNCMLPSIYGQASGFLMHAQGDYHDLQQYVANQAEGLKFARAFLKVKTKL